MNGVKTNESEEKDTKAKMDFAIKDTEIRLIIYSTMTLKGKEKWIF